MKVSYFSYTFGGPPMLGGPIKGGVAEVTSAVTNQDYWKGCTVLRVKEEEMSSYRYWLQEMLFKLSTLVARPAHVSDWMYEHFPKLSYWWFNLWLDGEDWLRARWDVVSLRNELLYITKQQKEVPLEVLVRFQQAVRPDGGDYCADCCSSLDEAALNEIGQCPICEWEEKNLGYITNALW
jgi:hypothetical protein